MRLGTNTKDSTQTDANNSTIVSDTRGQNVSPNPIIIAQQKQDLNMTAPIHSEQVKNGRKLISEFVSPPVNANNRDASMDYQTIQPQIAPQYPQGNERIAAY